MGVRRNQNRSLNKTKKLITINKKKNPHGNSVKHALDNDIELSTFAASKQLEKRHFQNEAQGKVITGILMSAVK